MNPDQAIIKALCRSLDRHLSHETATREKVLTAVLILAGESPRIQRGILAHLQETNPDLRATLRVHGDVPLGMRAIVQES